jgi:CBS domain-containing protein
MDPSGLMLLQALAAEVGFPCDEEVRRVDWGVWAVIAGVVILVSTAYLAGQSRARQILAGRSVTSAASSTRARDVMSSPARVVHEAMTAEEAARIMLDENIRSLLVVRDDSGLVGIVTESDLTGPEPWLSLRGWAQQEAGGKGSPSSELGRARAVRVNEVMSRPVVTASPADSLAYVMDRMMERNVHHIPVVENRIPVGVVARHDVLAFIARRA